MALDTTVTRFRPDDMMELRNLMQAVIRALLTLKADTCLFGEPEAEVGFIVTVDSSPSDALDGAEGAAPRLSQDSASNRVIEELRSPTTRMLSCMMEALAGCNAALMDLSGHRKHLGPDPSVSSCLAPLLVGLDQAMGEFDAVESTLLGPGHKLTYTSMLDNHVEQLFVLARHVREAAATVQHLATKVCAMQESSGWPRLWLPSYPFRKAIYRTNAQVRHDRGGVTAGSYHITFAEIARLLDKIKSTEHKPLPRGKRYEDASLQMQDSHATMDGDDDVATTPKRKFLRYRIWRVLHRLQGFESRYAFKVCLVTTLLSVPGYLDRTKAWWDEYEFWWAVAVGWLALHPQVGGNVQDLVTRGLLAILGAAWSGAAYAAGNGNPFVTAAFAAVYMVPMLYRFTQSSHPVLHIFQLHCGVALTFR